MAVFTVTTASDVVDAGDGVVSLREAIAQANATAAADTIRFVDALDGRTLNLSQGELTLTNDVAVEGVGSGITIDANRTDRVLAITGAGTDAVFENLGITGGYARNENGGGVLVGAGAGLTLQGCTLSGNAAGYLRESYADGGAVFAQAGSRVTVTDTIVRDNGANRVGGGIAAEGGVTVRVEDSRFLSNGAANGAGIALADGSSLTLSRSSVSGNDARAYRGGGGGGILADESHVRVSSSTISGNRGGYYGGGILANESTIELFDTTIAGNRALSRLGQGEGGAILGSGTLSLVSSTVTGNYATSDRSMPGYYGTGGIAFRGDIRVANSLVAGNYGQGAQAAPRATDIAGTITISNGHNVFGSDVAGDVAGDREGVAAASLFAAIDPASGGGALALNGGPTLTVALRDAAGNPALSGGDPVAAGEADQRGFARPLPDGSNPDIGAFELDQAAISRVASANNDLLTGSMATDTLSGLAGADLLAGRGGNDRLNGNDGGDTLVGGFGADLLDGGTGRDTASFRDAGSAVTASLASRTSSGALGADRLLRLENLEGGQFADRLEGDALANALGAGDGADRLFGLKGEDDLLGEGGADRLNGGAAADLLAGGRGRDLFDYDTLADSAPGAAGRDLVLDFAHLADRFDLSTLDARAATAANDAFTFLAAEGAAFTGAGQVRWFQVLGQTFLEANVNATRGADLQIEIAGLQTVTAADFVL